MGGGGNIIIIMQIVLLIGVFIVWLVCFVCFHDIRFLIELLMRDNIFGDDIVFEDSNRLSFGWFSILECWC